VLSRGTHTLSLDGSIFRHPGIYLVSVQSGDNVTVKKLVVK
jgi:hypothetical protein